MSSATPLDSALIIYTTNEYVVNLFCQCVVANCYLGISYIHVGRFLCPTSSFRVMDQCKSQSESVSSNADTMVRENRLPGQKARERGVRRKLSAIESE